ncbi:MAG: hypothetical protein J5I92_14780 [Thiogranum sp.]|nr:hypothetical protein [Thiogranum sp.]
MHASFHMGYYEWAELAFFWLLSLVVAVLVVMLLRPSRRKAVTRRTPKATTNGSRHSPEVRLVVLALPLNLLWEIAQFPLYTVWHQNDWSYILYGLAHCTLGDLLILLILYELIALIQRDRHWYVHNVLPSGALFTIAGIAYTIYSEISNVRIKGTWGYTELMPIVPLVEIGGTPFLQWLLIPPMLLWLMHLVSARDLEPAMPGPQ